MRTARHPTLHRWHERLTNWALWYAGATATGCGSAYDGDYGECAPRPPPPLVGAALDTQQLVQRLSLQHFGAVQAVYVWNGNVAQRAERLGVTPDAMNDRCDAAMFRLEEMDQERIRDMVRPPVTA